MTKKVNNLGDSRRSYRSKFGVAAGFRSRAWASYVVAVIVPLIIALASPKRVVAQTGGDLDTTFGNDGEVLSRFGPQTFATNSVIQPDGKVLVIGYTLLPNGGLYAEVEGSTIARYNPDGSLDSSFGTDGIVTIMTSKFLAVGVALQPDGKIVLSGGTHVGLLAGFVGNLALFRLNSDGSTDGSFGSNGLVADSDRAPVGVSLAIQEDGKIVVAATVSGPGTGVLVLERFNRDGSVDTSFGTNGTVVKYLYFAYSVQIQPDGKIVVLSDSIGIPVLLRLNIDGSPDPGFGNDGVVEIPRSNVIGPIFGMALDPNGKFVLVGATPDSPGKANFSVVRYNADGTPDASFGTDGVVTTDVDGSPNYASYVAIQDDGKIVVAGSGTGTLTTQTSSLGARPMGALAVLNLPQSASEHFALVRYNPDGSLDTSFGTGGKVITDFSQQQWSSVKALAIQQDGKIVAVGSATDANDFVDFALARYEPGTLSLDFSLSVGESSINVSRGTRAVVMVSIVRNQGFSGSVTISVPGSLPTGIVLKGISKVTTTGPAARFKFKVKRHAVAGSYNITFVGRDDAGQVKTAIVTIEVQ